MRITEQEIIKKEKHDIKGKNTNRKIYWPDLVFGPVNLWSLPPASFFYRKSGV